MAIRAEKLQVLETIIKPLAVYMMKFERDRLIHPF